MSSFFFSLLSFPDYFLSLGVMQPKPVIRTQSAYRQQQQQQQNAYRSPDEINISLQQRRPYFSQQTTSRYEEDDERYNYEK